MSSEQTERERQWRVAVGWTDGEERLRACMDLADSERGAVTKAEIPMASLRRFVEIYGDEESAPVAVLLYVNHAHVVSAGDVVAARRVAAIFGPSDA